MIDCKTVLLLLLSNRIELTTRNILYKNHLEIVKTKLFGFWSIRVF